MSRELQEKAEKIMRELEDALIPLKEELSKQKGNQRENNLIDKLR